MEERGHDVVRVTGQYRNAIARSAVPDADSLIIRGGYLPMKRKGSWINGQ
jgi:hypothetical protein